MNFSLHDHHIPQRHPDFVLETFDGEVLLYTITDARAVYLNETAHLIWLLCEGRNTVGEIVAALAASFPEAKDAIREDVLAALRSLLGLGAVTIVEA